MIEGCKFIKQINKVYACEYIYKNKRGIWPKLSVNYSNKVQYLYRIHKGAFDVSDQEGVNKKKYFGDNVHVPFENMIFFGDAVSDFKAAHKAGVDFVGLGVKGGILGGSKYRCSLISDFDEIC